MIDVTEHAAFLIMLLWLQQMVTSDLLQLMENPGLLILMDLVLTIQES